MAEQFRILEGATFCICDELGDFDADVEGLFAEDTRFLSTLNMTINGKRPLLLSSGRIEYFSAAFFMRNPLAGSLDRDELSIRRERFVGEDAMQDTFVVQSTAMRPVEFELALEVGSDFADIFAVKDHDFSLGDPNAPPLPPPQPATFDSDRNQFLLADHTQSEFPLKTQVIFSERGKVDGTTITFTIALEPRESWELHVGVFPLPDGEEVTTRLAERRFGEEVGRVRDSLSAWQLKVPQVRTSWEMLSHAFMQSVADLASLRMRSDGSGIGKLPGAGVPWFMSVFGRDTIITCLQTLIFGPELARTALEVLAELQAKEDDPSIDAEPGKIPHEVRQGKAAKTWFPRYYGTLDATPLYLVLVSEVFRWTDDIALARNLREPAMAALRWIDEYGDRDGDGFVEFHKRSERGLDVQSWKDSHDSQRFHDGTIAKPPIAPCEVQGYVYDAKRRIAELAREVWRDRELATRLDAEADELQRKFDEAFWCDERGGYYALALDGEKRKVDSLCSNIGHLLWSGIVPPHRVDAVVDALMGDGLWSGWGVRTMSKDDLGYNPLAYHNGTVWPHDNSLVAAGLARYERWPEAQRIIQRLMTAAEYFNYQLPEVFAGMRRSETPFPIVYPTAARPQAWAAGTPVLLLQLLLGLYPDRSRHALETNAPSGIPSWAGSIRLAGVRAFGRAWDVRLEDGQVTVEEA
ncbi:MAG: amylo-alpha-1,6-glucosidase [Actinobacteria bacterium]|nr:MAG: amylo-alpha-1,6-glucosidase [Actinomycetota bacterium]